MERPSGTTPASPGACTASAAQEQTGRAEGSAMEARPQGLAQAALHGPELIIQRDKDMIEDVWLERRDTDDSCISQFGPQRTNTGWSIAASTATDSTDLNSPDSVFADEGPDSEAETYASSPRRPGFLYRPIPSQKRLPIRVPSISSDAEKLRALPYSSSLPDALAPRHRRLEQMASRKSSLNQYTIPDGVPGPLSRGEPRPLGAVEPWNTEPSTRTEDGDTNRAGDRDDDRDGDQDDDSAGQGTVDMSRSVNLQAHEDVAEEDTVRDDGTDTEGEEDPPTSAEATPREDTLEAVGASAGAVTPHERPGSRRSEEGGGQSSPKPDDGIIHEVCDLVLQQAFGIQLHDVALAGSVSAAYESVSYCLDELSRIVLNSGLSNSGIVISESTWGRTGSSAVSIWPAGGVADSVGAGGGNGGDQGNGGGSRKRSNGGHDGAGPGDGAGGDGSPGGGKRQKVSPTHQQLPDMHFSCPFRKRNPVRFNVRDFQSCAVQSFPDIPQLKRHVKNFHKQTAVLPFTCQRCRRAMGTQKALDEHISVGRDQICDPQMVPSSADPEDGITSGIEEALNGRKADSKIDGWQSLWNRLFPGDDEIPEPDFVPPTELDEVYAEFKTDYWTRQLRQRIYGGSGPASNAESLLGVFNTHIDSVLEACRLKNGGTSSSRRQLRIQTTRQMTRRRSSVRLAPGRQGSGRSDSSISSPVATPNSTSMLGNLEQALMAEPQPQMPYSRPTSSYSGVGVDGVGGMMMSFVPSGSANAIQAGQPVTVPPPTQIHMGFGSQDHNTAGTLGGQLGQRPRLLPTDSGLALNTTFPDQRAADFSPVASFGPQNAYPNLNFEQPMPDLCLRPPPPGMHGVQPQAFSPTDAGMVPSITTSTFFTMPARDDDGYEVVGPYDEWP